MYKLLVLVCLLGFVAGEAGLSRRNTGGDGGSQNMYWNGDDGEDYEQESPSRTACVYSGTVDNYEEEDNWFVGRRPRQNRRVESATSEIARLLISAGQKMHQFCSVHSNRALREVYGVEHFQLRVRLSEFNEDSIQVRVRQRLVSIQARSCSERYAAVRILPDVVDARRAVWKFEDGTLTVLFPYNITPDTQLESYCGRQIEGGVIIVPQSAAGTDYNSEYTLSFGDANLRRAMKRYLREMTHEGIIDDNSEEYIQPDD